MKTTQPLCKHCKEPIVLRSVGIDKGCEVRRQWVHVGQMLPNSNTVQKDYEYCHIVTKAEPE